MHRDSGASILPTAHGFIRTRVLFLVAHRVSPHVLALTCVEVQL